MNGTGSGPERTAHSHSKDDITLTIQRKLRQGIETINFGRQEVLDWMNDSSRSANRRLFKLLIVYKFAPGNSNFHMHRSYQTLAIGR